MVTSKKNVGVSIPYKYVVYKRKDDSFEYKYEHISLKDAKQHVNRCLFVKEDLLTLDGNV